jgi:uncharacterized protein (DUF362 family)
MHKVIIREFSDYNSTVCSVLDELRFAEKLDEIGKIIIKPNLLQDAPPPCTTDVRCVEAVVKYIQENCSGREILILEGSGGCRTAIAFKALGYEKMSASFDVRLVDVDETGITRLEDPEAMVYKEIYLPDILFDSYLISVPSLKDHSMTGITLCLKNLIGFLPEKHYGGYWSYKRSDVHRVGVSRAIADLERYINIDLCIIDGRLGQQGSHLAGGRHCDPYKNVIIGGYDALEVDKKGAEILGHEWKDIEHLRLIEGENGG